MKNKITLTILAIFLFSNIFAQENSLVQELDISVYSTSFKESTTKIKNFIAEKNVAIIYELESKDEYEINFFVNTSDFEALEKILPDLGYLSKKELTSSNYNDKIYLIEKEQKYLQEQKAAYEKEISLMEVKDNRYYTYWENVREIDKTLFELDNDLQEYKAKNMYNVRIIIYDDVVDLTDNYINWVNMPGASADMLFIESPISNLSAGQYMGYSLKYMFTKGKTYAKIGTLKEFSPEVADSTRYKELFTFSFGQDFYSRYFGRGKNRFFNLYTGYNVGGMFATGEINTKFIFHLTPFFGVELFKNKYVLFDTRVGYFVPFTYNRNLRGIYTSASLNFVF